MRQWRQEERLKQADLIKSWQPWEKSTGAKTSSGKAIRKMNAYKNGGRSAEVGEMFNFVLQCKFTLKKHYNFELKIE